MSRVSTKGKDRARMSNQSFEASEEARSAYRVGHIDIDEQMSSRSASGFRRTERALLLKKSSLQTSNSRKILLSFTDRKYESSFVIPEFHNGSHTERIPLYEREEEEDMMKYQIRVTPPKDQSRDIDEKSLRTRVETDYQNLVENRESQHSVARSVTKSETDSIYNESAIKIRNQKREKNPITSFSQPIRKSVHPSKSNQTSLVHTESVVKRFRESNQTFVDPLWPPNNSQLFNMPLKLKIPKVLFSRLSKIYSKSSHRLLKHCDAINLVPGEFSSKRLHSALQILSQQPARVMNIVQNQDISFEGIYYLHLCQDGVWRYITIDDHLPVRYDGKVHLLFEHIVSESEEYEVWPGLIEKALAKVYGTYEDLRARQRDGIKDLFRLMTGYPCSDYKLNNDLKSFSIIMESALKQRHIVVLQCLKEGDPASFKDLNLNPSLSYQIIKCHDNTVVLRNYEQEVFVDAEYEFEEMSLFDTLLIFKCHEDYVYTSCTLRHLYGNYSQVQIQVEEETQCYFDVWQKNPSYFKPHLSDIDYAPAQFTLQLSQKEEPNEVLYIRESGVPVVLEAGVHILRIHLCLEFEFEFSISLYTENEVQITRVRTNDKWIDGCC